MGKLKKLTEHKGYSYYEIPDKELVDSIKSIEVSDIVLDRLIPFSGQKFILDRITDKGKYLMAGEKGDFISIEKDEYDRDKSGVLLNKINTEFDAMDVMNKYMLPFHVGYGVVITSVEDYMADQNKKARQKMCNMSRYGRFHSFNYVNFGSNKDVTDYNNGTHTVNYSFYYEKSGRSCDIYLNQDAQLVNRDYHVDFEKLPSELYVGVRSTMDNFIDLFNNIDVEEFEYKNGRWFCDDYVIQLKPISEKLKDGVVNIEFFQTPKQDSGRYYIQGESNWTEVKKPKITEVVLKSHLVNAAEHELIKVGTLMDPLAEELIRYTK